MTSEKTYALLEDISAYSVYIPIIICLLRVKALNKSLWVFFFYLILCVISDRISLVLVGNEKHSNIWFNTFALIEFGAITYIYFNEFQPGKPRPILLLLFFAFIIFSAVALIFLGRYDQPDTILGPIEAGIFTIYSSVYLLQILFNREILKITTYYFYWINFAFLLYFSTALLLFLNNEFISSCEPSIARVLWGIHLALNSATNILSAIGVWMKRTT